MRGPPNSSTLYSTPLIQPSSRAASLLIHAASGPPLDVGACSMSFQLRHGSRPESVDRPWQLRVRSPSSPAAHAHVLMIFGVYRLDSKPGLARARGGPGWLQKETGLPLESQWDMTDVFFSGP